MRRIVREAAPGERGGLLCDFREYIKTSIPETYAAYNLALAKKCVENEVYEVAEYTPGDFTVSPIDCGKWHFDTAPCYWDSGMGR